MSSLHDLRAQTLAATKPSPPSQDISGTISLTPEEDSICSLLDEFTKSLRSEDEKYAGVECRIAGGWVRDKLLGIPSNDIDIALADIMGVPFAEKLQAYMISQKLVTETRSVATIGRNPEQSKHLETARMNVLGNEVDFVNLRSETYTSDSRIPIMEIGTPLEDALRRDITINALFYNIHTRSVEDLTEKGLDDLRNGIVRTPLASLDTFRDDPLRVLRCVRFSSRFGFEIADEVGSAMRDKSIQSALTLKISRERVGEEFIKMLKGKSPLLSLSTTHEYDLYASMFGIPPMLNGKTSGDPRTESTALHAASILCSFLASASTSTSLPVPHPELLKLAREDHNLRQRLVFGAALTPWKNMSYLEKKKKATLVEGVIKEGLKIGGQNHFIPSVPSLFVAHERISRPSLDKFEGSSQRALIGSLLRDKHVHEPRTGTHWSGTLLFSLVQDLVELVEQDTLNDTQAREVIEMYNAFTDRIFELDLVDSIEEAPRLNGKDIGAVLGIKPGREIGKYMEHVVQWQLQHPKGDIEDCKVWLKELHEASGSNSERLLNCWIERTELDKMLILTAGLAAIGLLPVAYSSSDWPKQSFFFAWGDTSIPFTVPTTTQCETINIKWQRGSATGPDPVAPYTLQILTSNYVTPFYINAGSSLSYDYTVPFAPGTQYQICMYDANGRTGGCQAMYTVIPASSTPSCTNVTFPASLEVDAKSSSGPLSQYGWPDQCTDISLTPKSGTPPFTFTAAPALHPPVNITSNSMAAINWTIDLSWGSPFFITLADSAGLMWSYGPLHSGGNGPTACLAKELSGVVPIGATVGSVIGAFVLGGILASVLFFLLARRRPKYGHNNASLDLHSPKSSRELRPTPYISTDMGTRVPYSPLGTRDDAYSTNNSRRPMVRTDSSFGEPSPIGLAATGLQAEPFDPAAGSRRAASSTASPPMSPLDGPAQSQQGRGDTRSQVYVVHHDGGRAPVTIMTSDGAEVVELPPGYGSVPESSRARAVESQGRGGKGARQ